MHGFLGLTTSSRCHSDSNGNILEYSIERFSEAEKTDTYRKI